MVWDIFGSDRSAKFFTPRPRVEFASSRPGHTIQLLGGGSLSASGGPQAIAGADLVFLAPPLEVPELDDALLIGALRRAAACGSVIAAVDTSVFTLAHAGLLDRRSAALHWSLHDRFSQQFPNVTLAVDAQHVAERNLHTSAGGTAVADLCLHLIDTAFEGDVAINLEQHLVSGERPGPLADDMRTGQVRPDTAISNLLDWIVANVRRDLSLDVLSTQTYMSRRSLSRRFLAATGSTPHAWILEYRVRLAKDLLVRAPELTVDEVAARVGFRTAGLLRQHFYRATGRTPTAYRASSCG